MNEGKDDRVGESAILSMNLREAKAPKRYLFPKNRVNVERTDF